jgi:hypothetical protein
METYAAEQARGPRPIDPSAVPGAVRYRRHRPEETVLYRLVEQHLPAFQRGLAERGRPLPGFVLDEFRSYLTCGRMEHGFIRVKCDGCVEGPTVVAVGIAFLLPVEGENAVAARLGRR